MKLEVGKKYKTRNGQVACVASVKGYGPQSAIGFIEVNDSQCLPCQWFPTGEYFTDKMPCANDIVAEWTDTPDPGEGWRLLDVDEVIKKGDEYFSNNGWIASLNYWANDGKQSPRLVYRRRIAPQYVPYTWEDREELRGRWYRKKGDNSEFMVNYVTRHNENDIAIGPWREGAFLRDCEWLDGTPCGKAVQ